MEPLPQGGAVRDGFGLLRLPHRVRHHHGRPALHPRVQGGVPLPHGAHASGHAYPGPVLCGAGRRPHHRHPLCLRDMEGAAGGGDGPQVPGAPGVLRLRRPETELPVTAERTVRHRHGTVLDGRQQGHPQKIRTEF